MKTKLADVPEIHFQAANTHHGFQAQFNVAAWLHAELGGGRIAIQLCAFTESGMHEVEVDSIATFQSGGLLLSNLVSLQLAEPVQKMEIWLEAYGRGAVRADELYVQRKQPYSNSVSMPGMSARATA